VNRSEEARKLFGFTDFPHDWPDYSRWDGNREWALHMIRHAKSEFDQIRAPRRVRRSKWYVERRTEVAAGLDAALEAALQDTSDDFPEWLEVIANAVGNVFNAVRFLEACVRSFVGFRALVAVRRLRMALELALIGATLSRSSRERRNPDVEGIGLTVKSSPHAPHSPPQGSQDVPVSTMAAVALAA
jgi:hypothetical protein